MESKGLKATFPKTVRFTINSSISKSIARDDLQQNYSSPQEWTNHLIKWEPVDYGGVKHISLDASEIWQPDMVLYNK